MISLKINDEIKALALKHSDERLQYEYNRFGFPNEKRKNMILIGTLGQLIFKEYLDSNNIGYNYQLKAGEYDDFDFEIRGDIYEIKTSGYRSDFSKLNLLYSSDQYIAGLSKGFKYCVQIFVNGFDLDTRMLDIAETNEATIAGYIEFERIARFKCARKFYGDDYKIPVSQLKNIENLF